MNSYYGYGWSDNIWVSFCRQVNDSTQNCGCLRCGYLILLNQCTSFCGNRSQELLKIWSGTIVDFIQDDSRPDRHSVACGRVIAFDLWANQAIIAPIEVEPNEICSWRSLVISYNEVMQQGWPCEFFFGDDSIFHHDAEIGKAPTAFLQYGVADLLNGRIIAKSFFNVRDECGKIIDILSIIPKRSKASTANDDVFLEQKNLLFYRRQGGFISLVCWPNGILIVRSNNNSIRCDDGCNDCSRSKGWFCEVDPTKPYEMAYNPEQDDGIVEFKQQ